MISPDICPPVTRVVPSGEIANCTNVWMSPGTSMSSRASSATSRAAIRFSASDAAYTRPPPGAAMRACGRGKNTSYSSISMLDRSIRPIRIGGLTAAMERPTYRTSSTGSTESMPGVSNSACPTRLLSRSNFSTRQSAISETYQCEPSGSTATWCGLQFGVKPSSVRSIV